MCKVGFNFWLSFFFIYNFFFWLTFDFLRLKIKIANQKLHWGISLLLIINNIFVVNFFFVSIPFGGDFCFWDQYCQLEKWLFGPWIRDCNRTEHALGMHHGETRKGLWVYLFQKDPKIFLKWFLFFPSTKKRNQRE